MKWLLLTILENNKKKCEIFFLFVFQVLCTRPSQSQPSGSLFENVSAQSVHSFGEFQLIKSKSRNSFARFAGPKPINDMIDFNG